MAFTHRPTVYLLSLLVAAVLASCGGGGDSPVSAPPSAPAPVPSASIAVIAGSTYGSGNVDGTGRLAFFNNVQALAVQADGGIWVADTYAGLVRRVRLDGTTVTVAGSGNWRHVDGVGRLASFDLPSDITPSAAGGVFVLDAKSSNRASIRQVAPDGTVTTVPVPATSPQALNTQLQSIAAAPDGTLYAASWTAVWRSTPQGWDLLAGQPGAEGFADGPGLAARFFRITDLVVDADQNVYLTEAAPGIVRRIRRDGTVTLLAGTPLPFTQTVSADGVGTAARLRYPTDIALDAQGNLWVNENDIGDAVGRLRRITPAGEVTTPFGQQQRRYSAVALSPQGAVYVSNGLGVSRLAADGTPVAIAGQDVPDAPGLVDVLAMRVDASGSLLLVANSGDPAAPVSFQSGRRAVRRLAPDGRVLAQGADLVTTGLETQSGAVGPDGSIFVAAMLFSGQNLVGPVPAGGSLTRFLPDGSSDVLAQWPAGSGGVAPTSVVVDRNGAVYFGNVINGDILKMVPGGAPTVIARAAFSTGTMGVPSGYVPRPFFSVDDQGQVYLACGNALCRIENGDLVTVAGSRSTSGGADGTGAAAGFQNVTPLAIDRAGRVYVASNGYTVRRVTPAGVVTTIAGQHPNVGTTPGTLPGSLGAILFGTISDEGDLYLIVEKALVRIRTMP